MDIVALFSDPATGAAQSSASRNCPPLCYSEWMSEMNSYINTYSVDEHLGKCVAYARVGACDYSGRHFFCLAWLLKNDETVSGRRGARFEDGNVYSEAQLCPLKYSFNLTVGVLKITNAVRGSLGS